MTKSLLQCLIFLGLVEIGLAQTYQPMRISISGENGEVIATPSVQFDNSMITLQQPTAPQQPAAPMTPGRNVESNSSLSPGTRLVTEYGGKWLPVDVLEVKSDGKVRVHWVGWGNNYDEDMDRSRLRFPADAGGTGNGGSFRRSPKPKMVPILPKEFESRDKNGDGQIGMYEWERSKYSEFTKLDKNNDGFLTPQELNNKGNVFGARSRGGALEKDAQPAPGNMAQYNQKIGESFQFLVTGQTGGSIWGTGTYTTDSSLAAVAVHAGILKAGEKGVVTVTMVESPTSFEGSSANGVTSGAWGQYPAAYTVR